MTDRLPLPPFTRETALQKVQAAEDAWNTRDPERVAARAPHLRAASGRRAGYRVSPPLRRP
jgi:nuclear transport factor 2 (NTF2) superfamily protein